jgi:photosystem II stability/assembly factor-like uncharacterized protein
MKRMILLISLFLLIAGQTFAQWSQIKDGHFMSGQVNMFTSSGSNILAATAGGIFRSTDNGVNWTISNSGIDEMFTEVKYICKLGSDVFILMSGTGNIYKSSNNGISWNQINQNIPPFFHKVGLGLANNKLILLVYDYDPSMMYMYYSSDGSFWNMGTSVYLYPELEFQMYSFNSQRCYIVTATKVIYTTDGIITNQVSLTGLPTGSNNFSNHFSGEENSHYLYTVRNDTLFKFDTTTSIWSAVSAGPFNGKSIQVTNSTNNLLTVGTVDFSKNLKIDGYISRDHGTSWIKLSAGNYVPLFSKLLQLSPSYWIGNNYNNEILYSIDTGRTWTKSVDFKAFNTHKVISGNNALLTFSETNGILRSTDYSQTWNYSNSGLYRNYTDTNLCLIHSIYKAGNTLFAIVYQTLKYDSSFLYKSTNDGLSWTKVSTAPNYPAMQFMGTNNNTLFMRFG